MTSESGSRSRKPNNIKRKKYYALRENILLFLTKFIKFYKRLLAKRLCDSLPYGYIVMNMTHIYNKYEISPVAPLATSCWYDFHHNLSPPFKTMRSLTLYGHLHIKYEKYVNNPQDKYEIPLQLSAILLKILWWPQITFGLHQKQWGSSTYYGQLTHNEII